MLIAVSLFLSLFSWNCFGTEPKLWNATIERGTLRISSIQFCFAVVTDDPLPFLNMGLACDLMTYTCAGNGHIYQCMGLLGLTANVTFDVSLNYFFGYNGNFHAFVSRAQTLTLARFSMVLLVLWITCIALLILNFIRLLLIPSGLMTNQQALQLCCWENSVSLLYSHLKLMNIGSFSSLFSFQSKSAKCLQCKCTDPKICGAVRAAV